MTAYLDGDRSLRRALKAVIEVRTGRAPTEWLLIARWLGGVVVGASDL